MNVDAHVHPRPEIPSVTVVRDFDESDVIEKDRKMEHYAKKRGIDVVYYTPHATVLWMDVNTPFLDIHEMIPYEREEPKRLPGVEICVLEGFDVLLYGNLGKLEALDRSYHHKISKGLRPSVKGLLKRAEELNMVKVIAHPFRKRRVHDKILELFDAVEINGKDYRKDKGIWEKTERLAENVDKPLMASTDAHYPQNVGKIHTSFKEFEGEKNFVEGDRELKVSEN